MKRPAARVGDNHMCPLAEGGNPHGGGPLLRPGAAQVFIGGQRAARLLGLAMCDGPTDIVKKGAPMVLIEGLPAVRKGDATVHGGCVMEGFAMVLIGGAMAPTSDAECMEDALNLIRASDWAKTEEGKKVLALLEQMQKDGKLQYNRFGDDTRGAYKDGKVFVSDGYNRDPDGTASELVHEGTHAVADNESMNPFRNKNSVDEEVRTNTNQNDFYSEQRDTWQSDELDDRRDIIGDGSNLSDLRKDIHDRYDKRGHPLPEHS
jgi:uncharacterized Zn-binding protein involved in type VI secretion